VLGPNWESNSVSHLEYYFYIDFKLHTKHYLSVIVRQNDRLSSLSIDDRAKLDTWLAGHSYRSVIQLAAAPRPEGLALKTNLRALSRYFNKYLRPDPAAELAELIKIHPGAGEKAAISMIHAKAVLLAAKTDIDLDAFSLLLRFRRQLVEEKRSARLSATES
jgi:hypothetical protein